MLLLKSLQHHLQCHKGILEMTRPTLSCLVGHFDPAVQSKHLRQDSPTAAMYLSTNCTGVLHQHLLCTEKCWLCLQVDCQLPIIFHVYSPFLFYLAVSEVIKQQGGKESDTEYFAVLMTTLEVAETSEDSLGATLALLGMVIKRVPANVLKVKFSTSAKSLLDLLGRYIESDNSLLVRSLIGCLGVLLRNQDASTWSNSSTLQIYDALLTFVANPKPQVRKAAQHAIW